jgi:hypothetical protein
MLEIIETTFRLRYTNSSTPWQAAQLNRRSLGGNMGYSSLNSCIIKSLQSGQMDPDFSAALLTPEKNKARCRTEGTYWDYQEMLILTERLAIAEFAKDVAAFHNTNGGAVTKEYVAKGVTGGTILDTNQIRDKLRLYLGPIDVFQDSFQLPDKKFIWIIFIKKYPDNPISMVRHGPEDRHHRPIFVKGDFFYRDGDRVKRCVDDGDIERVFRGFSNERLNAYNYELDEPYFRLLMPNYESFVGRRDKIDEIKEVLELRHPIVSIDGLGGVGKTAAAIRAVRELYDEKKYLFIVSAICEVQSMAGRSRRSSQK